MIHAEISPSRSDHHKCNIDIRGQKVEDGISQNVKSSTRHANSNVDNAFNFNNVVIDVVVCTTIEVDIFIGTTQ